jgi:zinc protease
MLPTLVTDLPNGLRVLLRESHDAPVATFWAFYRVGGRNEVAGTTGVSHWVEHMLFKGTPTFPKGSIFREVNRNGGTLNGFTWIDYTTYFETLPSDRVDLAIAIESDRMRNASFDADEVASERTVIISERNGNENHPTFHLGEEVSAAAFKVHPYGQGVIGWKCDLETMTRDDLYSHYRRYYDPSNAVLVAVGDFIAGDMLKRIEDRFGAIPTTGRPPVVRSVEPEQRAERRVIVRRPGPVRYLELAFHTPPASHKDVVPLLVLDAILSGARGMGFGGREGSMGRSSRLYRRLVEGGLASGASSSYSLTRDPYLFEVSATLRPDVPLRAVEDIVWEELERVASDGVTESELAKVSKQVRAQLAYSAEGVTGQGYWLGNLEVVHTHTFMDDLADRVTRTTTDDVRRVAAAYLSRTNATVGWFEPNGASGAPVLAELPAAVKPAYWTGPTASAAVPTLEAIQRVELSNGVTVIGRPNASSGSVVMRAVVRAGTAFDDDATSGLASFTARAVSRGTRSLPFADLNELVDSLGASLGSEAATHTASVGFRSLAEDFPRMAALAFECLREPAFREPDVERLRGEIMTALREQDDDPGSIAEKAWTRMSYPANHAFARWPVGSAETIGRMTPADLLRFHATRYNPAGLLVVFAGNADWEQVVRVVELGLGDWRQAGSKATLDLPDVPSVVGTPRSTAHVEGKSQSVIVMGRPALSRRSPDYYALSFADLILGGLGLMGRLGESVRDQQGLAYHVSSSLESVLGPGAWQISAGVAPDQVERAIEAILEQVARIRREPITDAELADGKSYITGILPLALETNSGVARLLHQIELFELGLDYVSTYVRRVQALTKDDILSAAERYMSETDIAIAVAGPAGEGR